MTDATVARMLGFLFAVVGLVGGGIAWANDWSLFIPFALALVAFGIGCQILGWSWRRVRA
jgi:hypothetical protein